MVFPLLFLWFSNRFPIVFLCVSYGFPKVILWFCYGFPMIFPRFSLPWLVFCVVSARTPFPLHFHSLFVAPGPLRDPLGTPMGPPWAHLGVTWDPLGPFRRPLGPTLGGLWGSLGAQTEKHSKKGSPPSLFGTPFFTKK